MSRRQSGVREEDEFIDRFLSVSASVLAVLLVGGLVLEALGVLNDSRATISMLITGLAILAVIWLLLVTTTEEI